ncbi:MAG: YggS family pyridoxal phosphate-dependent enzyme [Cytophagales bacterium]|nr:YggS family pyridoxal phosphate-dependent enzyme [Cytophagales bacterium]
MSVRENIIEFNHRLKNCNCRLIAVSKTKPVDLILEAYEAGQLDFGENKVQELREKPDQLPQDIRWHMIGHLQTNKVKYIAPFIYLIHAVDSLKLLKEINKQALKNNRTINCLLQVHIAEEAHKFGFEENELYNLLNSNELKSMENIKIIGLMGMATYTNDRDQIRSEFQFLKKTFDSIKKKINLPNVAMNEISMGMSDDYPIALEEGSTMIRVGSKIFGPRIYRK